MRLLAPVNYKIDPRGRKGCEIIWRHTKAQVSFTDAKLDIIFCISLSHLNFNITSVNFFYFYIFFYLYFSLISVSALTWSVWCCLLPSRASRKGKRWSVIRVICVFCAISLLEYQTRFWRIVFLGANRQKCFKRGSSFGQPHIETLFLSIHYRWSEGGRIFNVSLIANAI